MKRIFGVFLFVLFGCSSTQVTQVLTEASKELEGAPALTSTEVGEGLKEALIKGVSVGTDHLSVVDGYYKNPSVMIPFPPDVKRVEDKLRQLGMGNQVDHFVMTMNRGAEDAATQAKPIFIDAVKAMTVDDAWGILKGQPDAATQYLKRTTSLQLREKFKPVIQQSLDKVEATRYYADVVNTYNRIPFVEKVNPDLNSYATEMAMQGLFSMIATEEKKIRDNPVERTTDLLKRVFENQH